MNNLVFLQIISPGSVYSSLLILQRYTQASFLESLCLKLKRWRKGAEKRVG